MIDELIKKTHLTPLEKTVVTYIKEHPECLLEMNAKELAKECFVSSPTVVRLSKKLGFDGYPDLQMSYVKDYTLNAKKSYDSLTNESTIQDVMDILPDIYQSTIIGTRNMMAKDPYVRTINYILKAKQVDFYANDNNYSQVQSACLKLNSLGIRAQAFNTINSQYVDSLPSQDMLAIVVSHTGSNKTMIDAAYYLRRKRIRTIAITGIFDQSLQLICNDSLFLYTETKISPSDFMTYSYSLTYILDILIMGVYLKTKKKGK